MTRSWGWKGLPNKAARQCTSLSASLLPLWIRTSKEGVWQHQYLVTSHTSPAARILMGCDVRDGVRIIQSLHPEPLKVAIRYRGVQCPMTGHGAVVATLRCYFEVSARYVWGEEEMAEEWEWGPGMTLVTPSIISRDVKPPTQSWINNILIIPHSTTN